LEREQEQSVVYGSIDFGKSVVTHPKYMDLLQRAGSQLKILPHTVINDKNEEIVLCSSVECKGEDVLEFLVRALQRSQLLLPKLFISYTLNVYTKLGYRYEGIFQLKNLLVNSIQLPFVALVFFS